VGSVSRAGVLAIIVAGLLTLLPDSAHRDTVLTNIPCGKTRILDLSYPISDKVVAWPGDVDPFEAQVNATIEKNGYFTRSFRMLEHFGTHLDAPIHFAPGKTTVDQIPTKQLFGPAVVLDVRAEAAKDEDYLLSPARVEEWEKKYGNVPTGAVVLLRTGWASRWPDVQKYRNQDAQGKMHFPGFSVEAVKLLIDRKVSGLGCDTMSADYGASTDFAVHHLSLGAGLYHLENLSDLSEVPDSGAFLIVAPIKLEGGSGGPVRVFAVLQ
jgi:kynurenine formamidase